MRNAFVEGEGKDGRDCSLKHQQIESCNGKPFDANLDGFSFSDPALSAARASRSLSPQVLPNLSFNAPWTKNKTAPP